MKISFENMTHEQIAKEYGWPLDDVPMWVEFQRCLTESLQHDHRPLDFSRDHDDAYDLEILSCKVMYYAIHLMDECNSARLLSIYDINDCRSNDSLWACFDDPTDLELCLARHHAMT